jgi:hypothetical protein
MNKLQNERERSIVTIFVAAIVITWIVGGGVAGADVFFYGIIPVGLLIAILRTRK